MNFSEQPSSSRCKRQKIKHPAHLKGKQIGLFYARQKWKKDGNSEDVRPRKDFFKKCVRYFISSYVTVPSLFSFTGRFHFIVR